MKKSNPRKIIRNLLMAVLVIDFLALVVTLTNLMPDNPLKPYVLELGLSFIVIASSAKWVCKSCKEEGAREGESMEE